jgi:hypothetical protein
MARKEHAELSAQFINSNFVRKLDEGRTKEAEDEGSRFIRSRMRQDSFAREILEPVEIGPDELDRDENTDQPKKIIEKEPDSTATYVTFKGTGQRTWFRGPRYSVYFGKVESQRFTKSKFELMTYQNDIRKILTDNSVKDMADQEDQKFYDTLVASVALAPAGNTIAHGAAGLDAAAIREGVNQLLANKIPCGKLLMTKELYNYAMELPASEVGDKVASGHYEDGIEGEKSLYGYPVITTIKNDIIPNDEMWFLPPQEYLGNFFLLQDATLFIKQEADIIEFWSYSAPGIGIGNVNGIVRMTNVV